MKLLLAAMVLVTQPAAIDGYCQPVGNVGEVEVMPCTDVDEGWIGYAQYGGKAIWINSEKEIEPWMILHEIGHTGI